MAKNSANEIWIDIDSMFVNNTPYLNFWHYCATHGLIAYDDETESYYPDVGFALFMNPSKDDSRNQLFRDFFDKLDIIWDDLIYSHE